MIPDWIASLIDELADPENVGLPYKLFPTSGSGNDHNSGHSEYKHI